MVSHVDVDFSAFNFEIVYNAPIGFFFISSDRATLRSALDLCRTCLSDGQTVVIGSWLIFYKYAITAKVHVLTTYLIRSLFLRSIDQLCISVVY